MQRETTGTKSKDRAASAGQRAYRNEQSHKHPSKQDRKRRIDADMATSHAAAVGNRG
jgi:hypothetical protein